MHALAADTGELLWKQRVRALFGNCTARRRKVSVRRQSWLAYMLSAKMEFDQ